MLELCTGVLTNDGSAGVQPLTPGLKAALLSKASGLLHRMRAPYVQPGSMQRWLCAASAGPGCHLLHSSKLLLHFRASQVSEYGAGSALHVLALASYHVLHSQPTVALHHTLQVSEYGAGSALRVLALAYRPWASERLDVAPADEQGLVFVGLVGMQVNLLFASSLL